MAVQQAVVLMIKWGRFLFPSDRPHQTHVFCTECKSSEGHETTSRVATTLSLLDMSQMPLGQS
jgi:hypothetical protein